jgi:hypothetical protein
MPSDPSRYTRRVFLKYTAMTTAMSGAWCSTILTTDAKEQELILPRALNNITNNPGPYIYTDEP